jgi:outer membrane lipoprotein-sorting protein
MKIDKNINPISPEEKLDLFIDALNQEHRPESSTESEVAELQTLVRKVRGLRPIEEPNETFALDLKQKLFTSTRPRNLNQNRYLPWTALVASLLVIIFLVSPWSRTNKDIVLAMEQTVKQLQNYHGTLEKVSTNAAGERQLIQRTEIWAEGNKYATRNENGIVTTNNGITRWQTQPKSKEIFLLPIYLDPHDFDLQNEATKAMQYPHKIIGEDSIASRSATRIEITPPGGLPYYLWIDTETHLPIQLQTAMQKSIQTTYTFVTLETNIQVPDSLFNFNLPQGYSIIDQNPDKLMNNLAEAITVSGMTPLEPTEKPQRIFASRNRIVFDFENTIVIESKATTPFVPDPLAALGQAEGGPLEILPDSLRWQQNSIEIKIQGQKTEDFAKQITEDIVLTPQTNSDLPPQPAVKVENDLEVVKRIQQQVDSGSSPWQLDPLQVAFTFVNLQISPKGINGEPPLDYNSLKIVSNNGTDAVIQIPKGPTKTVYVKRLIRQDQTGIWTVVGYDPR